MFFLFSFTSIRSLFSSLNAWLADLLIVSSYYSFSEFCTASFFRLISDSLYIFFVLFFVTQDTLHLIHKTPTFIWSHMRTDAALRVRSCNSTTHNLAHLTSKHPPSAQKMGEGDYGRTRRVFVLFLMLGRRADRPMIFHIFPYLFYQRFLVNNCSKFCVKKWDPLYPSC